MNAQTPDNKHPNPGEKYTCANCQQVFETTATKEELEQEQIDIYGHVLPEDDQEIICDDCFHAYMNWTKEEGIDLKNIDTVTIPNNDPLTGVVLEYYQVPPTQEDLNYAQIIEQKYGEILGHFNQLLPDDMEFVIDLPTPALTLKNEFEEEMYRQLKELFKKAFIKSLNLPTNTTKEN